MVKRQTMLRSLGLMLGFLVVALSGCGKESGKPVSPSTQPVESVNMNDANGGFTDANESPAFGSQETLAELQQELEINDPVAEDSVVRDLMTRPDPRMYVMTVLWGKLQSDQSSIGPDADGNAFDWTGSLSLNRGAILVRTAISFEKQDSILPRANRETVGWVSHTDNGFDGIRVVVFPPANLALTDEVSLTLDMPLYHHTFTLSELDRMSEMVAVDSLGNQVSISAFLVPPTANSVGFLRGRWSHIADGDSVGGFSGVWVGSQGRVAGTIRGRYGYNATGTPVLFGKFIDATGRFQGILRGTWEIAAAGLSGNAVAKGTFSGRWIDLDGQERGSVRGHWRLPNDKPGFFDGTWCVNCPLAAMN